MPPRIVVPVKAVALDGPTIDGDGGLTSSGSLALDPINEVAIEWALQARDAGWCESVVAVTLGPLAAVDAVRRALAMGCDDGLVVVDDGDEPTSVGATARALAGAIRSVGAGLAVFGYESLDGSSGAAPAATAAVLGWPILGFARTATVDDGALRAERDLGHGPETLLADLPCVLTMTAGGVEPRFPILKAVLDARRREVPHLDRSALDVAPAVPGARQRVVELRPCPQPRRATRVVAGVDGAVEIERLLTELRLLDA